MKTAGQYDRRSYVTNQFGKMLSPIIKAVAWHNSNRHIWSLLVKKEQRRWVCRRSIGVGVMLDVYQNRPIYY